VDQVAGGRKVVATSVALMMLAITSTGCVDDGDGTEWKDPTTIVFTTLDVIETRQVVLVNFTLTDKDGLVTKADGALEVTIWDSDGLEMFNRTFTIKAKEFNTFDLGIIKTTSYALEIPFADMARSHDRGYNGPMEFTERRLHGTLRFTFGSVEMEDTYHIDLLNPEIPEALLFPNQPPMADLRSPSTGFVEFEVVLNASNSTDPEGGVLAYTWDVGDGSSIHQGPEMVKAHNYVAPGIYEVSVTVIDPEDASDTATLDIIIEWAVTARVNGTGNVTEPGPYLDHTYVELILLNQADGVVPVPPFDAVLIDDMSEEVAAAGIDGRVPESLAAGEALTIIIYFDTPEGFDASWVGVMGRQPMALE
jgi:hypothetical protein